MEELLNKLIEKGWCPFYDTDIQAIKIYSNMDMECIYGKRKSDFYYTSPRKITSKESGLWQFCCENELIGKYNDDVDKWSHSSRYVYDESWEESKYYNDEDYQYRLIESTLRDESELEQFLVDNIKV